MAEMMGDITNGASASSGNPIVKPEDLSKAAVVDFLTTHHLVHTGPRILLNWRYNQFLAGQPVLRSPRAPIPLPAEIPKPLCFTRPTIPYYDGLTPANFFQIPSTVVETLILPRLDDDSLLSFMLVSRYYFHVCHHLATVRSRQRFGNTGGTVMALSCFVYYQRLFDSTSSRRAKKKPRREYVTRQLGISKSIGTSVYVSEGEIEYLVKSSIHKNGTIDALIHLPALREHQLKAKQLQDQFIESCVPGRLQIVNQLLLPHMSMVRHPGKLSQYRLDRDAKLAIILLNGNTHYYKRLTRSYNDFINMRSSLEKPLPPIFDWFVPIALDVLKTHSFRPTYAHRQLLAAHVNVMLWELMQPSFYGSPLTDSRRELFIRHIFSEGFLRTVIPAFNIIHLWDITNNIVSIVGMKDNYSQPGYETSYVRPATNQKQDEVFGVAGVPVMFMVKFKRTLFISNDRVTH